MPRVLMRHLAKMLQAEGAKPCVEIQLFDEIVHDQLYVDWGMGQNAKTFASEITTAMGEQDPSGCDIVVKINSYGGDVSDGVTMYNILRDLAAKGASIKTQIMGVAYSAASVVFMGGDVREIMSAAEGMIHEARYGWIPTTVDAKALDQYAADLRRTNANLAALYSERMGKSADEILQMMAVETYLSGTAAVDAGFATATSATRAVAVAGTAELLKLAGVRKVSEGIQFSGMPAAPLQGSASGAAPIAQTVALRVASMLGVSLDGGATERLSLLATQLEGESIRASALERANEALASEVAGLTTRMEALASEHAKALEKAAAAHQEALAAAKVEHEAAQTKAVDVAVRAFALQHSIQMAPSMPAPENVTDKPDLAARWGAAAAAMVGKN